MPTPMGWLDFLASIIGSLAWPGVVLVILWYNRQRLANLPDWIEELTLPGGTTVKFTKAVEKASAEAGLLAAETAAPPEDQVASSSIAEQFPEATVVQSFIEIVETLGKMVHFLALPTKGRDPMSVVMELARLGYIDQTSVRLFVDLKDGYDAAVRSGYGRLPLKSAFGTARPRRS